MKDDKIRVSELFYSLQGEGNTMGRPSIFLRLTGCNLMCGGPGTEKDMQLHNGATWRCDTIEVWLKGSLWTPIDLSNHIADSYPKAVTLPSTQLVITGGEPLRQEEVYSELISHYRHYRAGYNQRVEVETNGTIAPKKSYMIHQYNVSPKLSNSGMSKKRRIKPEAMQAFSELTKVNKAIFKFVITDKADYDEMERDYLVPFGIPMTKVWLMPGCSTREQYEEVAPLVAELCKQYGCHFSSRLQVNLWNEVTGV